MSGLVALALSIGVLGGVATWLALGPLAGVVTIWMIFIAWGSYFHNGGDNAALKNTIVCGIFGSIMAGIGALLILNVSLGALTAPIWVGVTVFILVYASKVPALSVIPTAVYGYAATFAYLLEGARLNIVTMGAIELSNPVVVVSLSFIVGTLFAAASGKLAGALGSD